MKCTGLKECGMDKTARPLVVKQYYMEFKMIDVLKEGSEEMLKAFKKYIGLQWVNKGYEWVELDKRWEMWMEIRKQYLNQKK